VLAVGGTAAVDTARGQDVGAREQEQRSVIWALLICVATHRVLYKSAPDTGVSGVSVNNTTRCSTTTTTQEIRARGGKTRFALPE
jgi:hypothetical protein